MAQPLLFTPMKIRDTTLKNRIVVAPMHQYSGERGFPTDWHLMNIGKFAAGGAGLVFVESTKVERRGCGTVGDLGLWNDEFIPHFKRLADFIRLHGSVPAIQIGHSGRKARLSRPWEGGKPLEASPDIWDWDGWDLVAPSGIAGSNTEPVPRELTTDEVRELVTRWADAAERADKAGFEVLEIHGAHGYLIHQFLSPYSNRRTDEYGGDERKRMRFAIEIVEAVRARWPRRKPLFMRFSVEDDAGWGPDQSVALARIIGPMGVDVIDCSSGGMLGRPVATAQPSAYGFQVPYAERLKKDGGGVLSMAVGLIVHADQAERILQEGRADLVALAREILYNPNWPMDAAQKLGVDPQFSITPPPYSYWLSKRAGQMLKGMKPSTYGNGEAA